MELIQHSINWAKGEILEATIMAIVGLFILLGSALFWKYGNTPYAKAMVIPFLVVGLIPVFFGITGVISNKNRMLVYEKAWKQDKQQFILNEKARVKGFDEIFKYSYPFAIFMTIGGAILFFLVNSPNWKAISLAMMSFGLMAYFIDHFAAERAAIYLEEIKKAL
jgi:glycerol uptake facilitator-like aquaporin